MNDCQEITHGGIIAIDGKCLRASYNQKYKKDAIHMVSAFAAANEVVIGQIKTNQKSNEITAIPELLKLLDIRGCLVTIDAMGCQSEIAKNIVDKGGDHLLAVKGNQPRLFSKLNETFDVKTLNTATENVFSQSNKGHEIEETRHHLVKHGLAELDDIAFEWVEIKTIGYVVSFRAEKGEIAKPSMRFYISSAKLTAEEFAHAARTH